MRCNIFLEVSELIAVFNNRYVFIFCWMWAVGHSADDKLEVKVPPPLHFLHRRSQWQEVKNTSRGKKTCSTEVILLAGVLMLCVVFSFPVSCEHPQTQMSCGRHEKSLLTSQCQPTPPCRIRTKPFSGREAAAPFLWLSSGLRMGADRQGCVQLVSLTSIW